MINELKESIYIAASNPTSSININNSISSINYNISRNLLIINLIYKSIFIINNNLNQ